jgi:3-dehydroquinate synthase
MIIQVKHHLGEYPVYIGADLLANPQTWLSHIKGRQVMMISNQSIAANFLPLLHHHFKHLQCDQFVLADGESSKNWQNLQQIWDALISQGHRRDTTLVAIGGGVVTDITGFAAACYLRGVNYISIPTSLLAQVDAAIGGKTAINHPRGKNLIGAFHQPQAVIIDTHSLRSLPERHFRAGLAEIIKAALIQDQIFFHFLENNSAAILARDEKILTQIIYRACQIKAHIVMQDERENQQRALLNFGHTFGHAIECVFDFKDYLHGEAVAIGMVLAARLSLTETGLTVAEFDRIVALLDKLTLPCHLPPTIDSEKLLQAIYQDKKNSHQGLNFILLTKIGQSIIKSIQPEILKPLALPSPS